MDKERKRFLKAVGKAEVQRRSDALERALRAANPAPPGSDDWAKNYRAGTLHEKKLRQKLPILPIEEVEQKYVVLRAEGEVGAYVGQYLQCMRCGSVLPAAIPKRAFYWGSCACGNVKWRVLAGWNGSRFEDLSLVRPVTLLGKGK